MKKILTLITIIMMISIPINPSAETSVEDIKVEAIPMIEDLIYYKIEITGLTEDVYISVYENDNETTTIYNYSDTTNGTLEITHWYIYEKVKYTVTVYGVDDECQETPLKVSSVETKKYNMNYEFVICEENADYEKCDPFYEETEEDENQTSEEFHEELNEYLEEQDQTTLDKIFDIIKEYYLFVLIPVILIGGIYTVLIIIEKNKRSDK